MVCEWYTNYYVYCIVLYFIPFDHLSDSKEKHKTQTKLIIYYKKEKKERNNNNNNWMENAQQNAPKNLTISKTENPNLLDASVHNS